MSRCLVLGADGFIGSHLSERLVKEGFRVRCFDLFKDNPKHTKNLESIKEKIEIIGSDFLDKDDLDKALEGIDYVFHFISFSTPYSTIKTPETEIDLNIKGTLQLLNLCVKHKVKKIIYPSSGGTIYGNNNSDKDRISEKEKCEPMIPYSITKLYIERLLFSFNRLYSLDFCVLRFSNLYGPRLPLEGNQGVIGIMMNAFKNNKRPTIYGDGKSIRDYLYIDDAITSILLCTKNNTKHNMYNVGYGKGHTVSEIFDNIKNMSKKDIVPVYKEARENEIKKIVLDTTRFSSEFKWKPKVSFEDGLEKVWRWLDEKR